MNKTTTESSQAALVQTADSLMASVSSLREVMELLLNAEDTVDKTHGLNLRSLTALKHLQVMGNSCHQVYLMHKRTLCSVAVVISLC